MYNISRSNKTFSLFTDLRLAKELLIKTGDDGWLEAGEI